MSFPRHPVPPQISTLSLHDALPILKQNEQWTPLASRRHDSDFVDASSEQMTREPVHDDLRAVRLGVIRVRGADAVPDDQGRDRKSTRLNSSHVEISYAVFCLKKKKK